MRAVLFTILVGIIGCSRDPQPATALSLYLVADHPSETTSAHILDGQTLHLQEPAVMQGPVLRNATVVRTGTGNEVAIAIAFAEPSSSEFASITRSAIGQRLAVVVSGVPLIAPVIQDPILGGALTISGRFSEDEAWGIVSEINGNE